MKKRHLFFTFYILCCWLCTAAGQGLVNVRHFSVKDGLSHNTVQSMLQDDEGYLWMATWNGLDKFDGYTFKNYKSYPTDKVKLRYNRMVHIEGGKNHKLFCWCYDNRVYMFDTRKAKFEDIFAAHPEIPACHDVTDMMTLPDGVVWIVSRSGELWRVDSACPESKEGVKYFASTPDGRQVSAVFGIVAGGNGTEWILTDKGYWTCGSGKRLHGKEVYRYAAAVGDDLYLADAGKNLTRYREGEGMKRLRLPAGVGRVRGLMALKDGLLGVVTHKELAVRNTVSGEWMIDGFPAEAGEVRPERMLEAANGVVWILNRQRHILRCDWKKGRVLVLDYPKAPARSATPMLHQDMYGKVWAFPSDGLLCCYDRKQERFVAAYTQDKGEKTQYDSADKRAYLIDYHQNLWLFQASGVDRVAWVDSNYDYIRSTDGVPVRGLYVDSKRRLWTGGKDFIVQLYDMNRRYVGNLTPSGRLVKDVSAVFGSDIYAFFEDRKGNLWIGSRNDGLFVGIPQGDGYRLIRYQSDGGAESINCNSIYAITEDAEGKIWIGTYGGGVNLAVGEVENLRFIHAGNRLKDAYPKDACMRVRSLCVLKDGVVLAGTTEGLLSFSSRFTRPEDIRFYRNRCEENRSSSLSDNDVLHVLETSSGEVYVTAYGGGVSRLKSGSLLSGKLEFEHYNKKNGLPSDMAFAMAEDNKKQLWVTFQNMICKFIPQSQSFEVYDHFNVNSNLILSEGPPAIDNQDNLYIGCNNGALRLNLSRQKKSSYVPNLVFTGVGIQRRGGVSTRSSIVGDTLVLQRNERNITVSFAALDFTNPASLQYAYRVPELGDEWNYIGKNRSVTLVNLPAGNFNLEVCSTNSDDVWVENARTLHLNVVPTFWETGWAWVVYVLAFLMLLTLISGIIVYIWNLRKKIGFEKQLTDMKLRFFTDISHELRTPLTLIEGPIEEVLAGERLSEEGRNNMRVAKRNTERMLQLINQLLDFRKIQNQKMKLYIERIEVVSLLRRVFENFEVMARQQEVDFRFVAPETEIPAYTDADKLEKIVFNLLSNAFKYTPGGKSVRLIVEYGGNAVRLQVKDEGKGIDVQKLAQLFDRFETLGKQRTTVSTGIGLSLVHNLVELMHGRIDVTSSIGQGSTFTVTLPADGTEYRQDANAEFILDDVSSPMLAAEPEEETPDGDSERPSVLVVEDNTELRHFVARILQKDYRVLEAENGREGFARVMDAQPDVVVSDVMMPEMDGIELLDAIKTNHEVCHIPVILLSAKASLDDRVKGLEYGADGYITKPFSSNYLRARLKSLFLQRTRMRDYLMSGELPEEWEVKEKKPDTREESQKGLEGIQPSMPQITRFDEEFIGKILEAVERNLSSSEFRIEDLADSMNMGRSMFYRKIKAILGVSPIDFVKDMRIKRSVQLLDSGEYAVSEVAYMCGFSSPQYFSRVFRQAKGCSPSEYKERVKRGDAVAD